MPLAGIYVLAGAGVALALWAPLEVAFGAVLGAWMLVPAGLILPGLLHIFLVDRIVLGAFALRLLLRSGRAGEPTGPAYRPTPLHLALAVMLLVGYLDGSVLAPGSLHNNLVVWLTTLDTAVFFVLALAVLRTIGIWRVLRPLAAVVTVAAGIGVVERLTGHGWAAYLAEHVPAAYQSSFIFPLATRGASFRAQGASEFALEFGWVLAVLVPIVAVAVSSWIDRNRSWGGRRQLLLAIPAAAVLALLFSASRSAEIGVAVGAVLVVVAAGAPRRLTLGVVAAGVVVLLVAALAPSLITRPFTAAAHTNSIQSRLDRLPILFSLTAHRPFVGSGYTGYSTVLIGADDSYALTYVQLGVVGLLSWGAVLVTSFAVALRTLRAPVRSSTRVLGAACAVGILGVAVAAAGYDLTFTEQSMWALALLGACAVVLGERLAPRARARRSWARTALPVVGAAVGAAVLFVAPLSSSRTYTVYLVSPSQLPAMDPGLVQWTAEQLAPTICAYLTTPPRLAPGSDVRCSRPGLVSTSTWQAEIQLRIGATSPAAVEAEARRALGLFERLRYPTVAADGPVQTGKPAWAVTAPVSGAAAGLLAAWAVPPLRRRRRAEALRLAYGA